jgi:glycerophosphoryl diester phosphodiesterase
LDYSEIKKYDVGSLGNKDFPEQQKMKTYKPLLSEVFVEIGKYVKKNKLQPVRYNIEIKSNPEGDNTFHPLPTVFAKMVYDEILAHKLEKNVIVQSFDVRPLQELRKFEVKLTLAFWWLTKTGIEKNLEKLGFLPDTYSPHFSLIDEPTVQYARQKGMKIIPWTINETSDMERMKQFNLDGIITDYPDRAVKVFRK